MRPAHHGNSLDVRPSCWSVCRARGPQSGAPSGSSSKLNGWESKSTEIYVALYFIGCVVLLIQRKVPCCDQLLLLLRLQKTPEKGQSMAPPGGSSLTRPFLPVVRPNVSGPKLPPTASPGLELLPPSSFMPHGVRDAARVSSPPGCPSLSLVFILQPLLLFFLESLGHLTSVGTLHTRPKTSSDCSANTQPLSNVWWWDSQKNLIGSQQGLWSWGTGGSLQWEEEEIEGLLQSTTSGLDPEH